MSIFNYFLKFSKPWKEYRVFNLLPRLEYPLPHFLLHLLWQLISPPVAGMCCQGAACFLYFYCSLIISLSSFLEYPRGSHPGAACYVPRLLCMLLAYTEPVPGCPLRHACSFLWEFPLLSSPLFGTACSATSLSPPILIGDLPREVFLYFVTLSLSAPSWKSLQLLLFVLLGLWSSPCLLPLRAVC